MKLVGIKLLVVLSMTMIAASGAFAQFEALLYADSAPNVYGSPSWDGWWSATKTDIIAGTFTDMRTGTYPGTHWIDPNDEIVYNAGDLGKRLHWMYQLPDWSIAELDGMFQVKWVVDWAGEDWTWSAGAWALDDPNLGWAQPGSWEDYSEDGNNGVIGSFGFAWDGSGLDLPSLRSDVLRNQTYAKGMIRSWVDSGGGEEKAGSWSTPQELTLDMVPEPGSLLLLGFVVAGSAAMAAFRRKKL